MSLFHALRANPPKITVGEGCKEVVFTLVSAMCDNVSYLVFKKNSDGEFYLRHRNDHVPLSFSNLQCKTSDFDLCWLADDENWPEIINLINTGTSRISSVKYR